MGPASLFPFELEELRIVIESYTERMYWTYDGV